MQILAFDSSRRAAAAFALMTAAAAAPALAASTASMSASDSASALVGSVSNSVRRSSDSSTGGGVAQGEHRIVHVAVATDRPDLVELTLRHADAAADDAHAPWRLRIPLPLAAAQRFAAGGSVHATARPYGVEFAAGTPRTPFFLVLHDDWYRELHARPLAL